MKINIALELKNKLPEFTVIAYTMTVDNNTTWEVDELIGEVKVIVDLYDCCLLSFLTVFCKNIKKFW